MDPEFKIWGKKAQAQPPAVVAPPPQPQPPEPEYAPAPEEGYPQQQMMKPPGKLRIAGIIALQLVAGTIGLLVRCAKKLLGLCMIGLGKTLQLFQRKNSYGSPKKMSLKAVFLGAALVVGGMMAPGAYYMTQSNDIVRTRVTGKVMADAKAEFPGQKYFIYTNQGKFDTYGVDGGKDIREGCVYDFNVKSARLEVWPPGYTRSIVSFKPAPGGDCAP